MERIKRLFVGGTAGNGQLTAIVGSTLIVLLAVEGVTILNVGSLLTWHAFVGILLIPVVGLKLASIGWRMFRYYTHAGEYVRLGPPPVLLRMLVAPVVVVSTIIVFGTGVALLALNQRHGTIVGLHKAAFVVWLAATGIHVLAHLPELPALLQRHAPGTWLRVAILAVALGTGVVVAVATLPQARALRAHHRFEFGDH